MPDESSKPDIRIAAEAMDKAIALFFAVGMLPELERAILLREFIMQTYDLEKTLEARADHIQTETYSLGERLREMHGGKGWENEKDDGGRGEGGP